MILKGPFQLDRSRGGVHGIIDKSQDARLRGFLITRDDGLHFDGSGSHVFFDRGQILFGKGKSDVNGVDLVNHDDGEIICLNDISRLDQKAPRASADGGAEGTITELNPGGFYGSPGPPND